VPTLGFKALGGFDPAAALGKVFNTFDAHGVTVYESEIDHVTPSGLISVKLEVDPSDWPRVAEAKSEVRSLPRFEVSAYVDG
jgi:hypothetical protein